MSTQASTQEVVPHHVDSETQMLMRQFLNPILESAPSWQDVRAQFGEKGYQVQVVSGRLVVTNEEGRALCTGSDLGVSLDQISTRIGRPQ